MHEVTMQLSSWFGLTLLLQSPPGLMHGSSMGVAESEGDVEGTWETVGEAVGESVGVPVRSQKLSS